MENAVTSFDNALSFSISINPDSLSNILISSLKLYFWNETTALWEPLLSFFDESTNILTAQSNHLSRFAVFGEKIDSSPPQTYITVLGDGTNGWFSNFPTIDLNPTDPENSQIKFTIYSINSGKDWENYLQPFTLEKDGVTNFMFRSQDVNGNLEDTKSYVIQVNVSGKQTNNIKVVNASFDVQ